MLGHEVSELIGKHYTELLDPDSVDVFRRKFPRLLGGRSVSADICMIRKDGAKLNILCAAQPILDSNGKVEAILALNVDITERKKAEEALIARDHILRESQRVAALGSYDLDIASGVWTSTEIMNNVFGLDADYRRDIEGWRMIIHPDDREEMATYFTEEVLAKRKSFDREYRIIRHCDSELRWVHGLGKLEFDSKGNPVRMIGIIQDITERKMAEQELIRSEHRLELAHEAAGMGMFDWNIEHDQAVCNERYFEVLGLKPQERMLSEKDWLGMVHPDDRERAQKEVGDALTKRVPYDIEYRVVWPDGSVKWVSSMAKSFFDDDGKPVRMIGAMTDITERKKAEDALQERLRLESLLAEMSASFINLPSSKVDKEIKHWLERVGASVGAGRCVVWTRVNGADHYVPSHSWTAAGNRSRMPESLMSFPGWWRAYKKESVSSLGSTICPRKPPLMPRVSTAWAF